MSVQNFACVAPRLFSSLISVTGQTEAERKAKGWSHIGVPWPLAT